MKSASTYWLKKFNYVHKNKIKLCLLNCALFNIYSRIYGVPPLLVFFMPHTISYVSDCPYYEVKLVFIILREDGSKTSTEDAREVANQWVSN